MRELRAAVAGTGFVGAIHVEALRRLDVEVVGVCASTAERAEAKGLAPAYESYEALLADERVDVVHVTTPNHLHHGQVRDALAAGKHVVCEKPLATTSAESAELLELAQQERARALHELQPPLLPDRPPGTSARRVGGAGRRLERPRRLPPGLAALPDRLELAPRAGEGRGAAGGCRHRLALDGPRAVGDRTANRARSSPTSRRRYRCDSGHRRGGDVRRRRRGRARRGADDDGGHRESPVSAGRGLPGRGRGLAGRAPGGRTACGWRWTARKGALAWDAERHEELWLGHRDRANETLLRNPGLLEASAQARTTLPAGHAEGFAATFRELYRAVYSAVSEGGMPAEPDFPTFDDGHRSNVLGDAIAASNDRRQVGRRRRSRLAARQLRAARRRCCSR